MVTVTDRKVKQKQATKKPPIRGIVAAAKALGVTRQHLYLVLKGERVSPGLIERYETYQQQQRD